MSASEESAAALVRRAREDAGMSQRDLAARAGLKQPNLAAIESGAREPSSELLSRILRAARLRPSIPLELFASRIRALGPRYGVSNIRVFGSAARGTDTERSDVDLLVDAVDEVDFLTLAAFREEVASILGFPVDAVVDDPDDEIVRVIRREAVPL
ncbi:XRE family transcriptional regulator [Agromyces sp. H66]|uniref:XRE family transcriptional regulator n=1 Tax=Agromyces sp. H66 TaxID=2529859 RepID=UPI0010AB2923|nr:XRE family transcriptional regulator [Agromyces sp. H66]